MRLVVTFLVTAIMAVHAALGCCAHHEHHASAESSCEGHHCHGHHESPAEEPVPHDCEEEQCVFVGSRSVTSTAVDLVSDLTLLPVVLSLDENLTRIDSVAAREDCVYPAGPALHLWHGVLVI